MNIIVIEDYASLRTIIIKTIEKLGHSAYGLSCAEEFDDVVARIAPDILVIDLNLPEEDGISLSQRIRKVNPLIGIIMLTARDRDEDKVLGYESGADIYLTKPVPFSELAAAISALVRRISSEKFVVNNANLILDNSQQLLNFKDIKISINKTESIILQALACAKNQLLEHWQLLEILGEDIDSESAKSYLSVRIFRLRQKLIEVGLSKNSLKNHHQQGYQLCINLTII